MPSLANSFSILSRFIPIEKKFFRKTNAYSSVYVKIVTKKNEKSTKEMADDKS